MSPVRVLCVFSTLDRGGAESMAMSLLRNIDRKQVIFDFVKHTSKKGAFEDEIKQLGGLVFTAPRYKIYNHISYISWWKKFLRQHPEYHIIHGHFFTISSVFFKVAHKAGRITIGHSHCTDTTKDSVTRPIVHFLGNILIGQIEKNSDYCLACSEDAGKWVFKNKEFTVLNNAIDVRKFRYSELIGKKVRKDFNLEDNLVIGNVSRFNLQKNPFGTLEIFKQIHEKRPNSKLLWVGEGPLKAEVQKKAKEYGIQNDVIFTGVRNDVDQLLQAMDAFIFPSFYEGLGIAAVEAQAAGVETYCSTFVPREVAVTELCHFIPLNQKNDWSDQISKITAGYRHPDMTRQIIDAGYDIHETAIRMQDFYISIDKNNTIM